MVRTYIKKVKAAVATTDYDQAQAAFIKAQPYVDKMVTKGVMHKNTAARIKSRLNKQVFALKGRSEEHTSELQSRPHLVCRLLLEKKKKKKKTNNKTKKKQTQTITHQKKTTTLTHQP